MFRGFREIHEVVEDKGERNLPPLFALCKDRAPLTPEEIADLNRPICQLMDEEAWDRYHKVISSEEEDGFKQIKSSGDLTLEDAKAFWDGLFQAERK